MNDPTWPGVARRLLVAPRPLMLQGPWRERSPLYDRRTRSDCTLGSLGVREAVLRTLPRGGTASQAFLPNFLAQAAGTGDKHELPVKGQRVNILDSVGHEVSAAAAGNR